MASSLSSTLAFGSEEDAQQLCDRCVREGRQLDASGYCTTCKEYLCEVCFRHHKRSETLRRHILLNSDEMLRSTVNNRLYSGSEAFDELVTPCGKHSDQVMNFYCGHHQALICSTCKRLDHDGINCSVIYIPDESEQTLDGKDYGDSIKYLEALIKQSEQGKQKFKSLATKSDASLEESFEAMKNFRRSIDEKMEALEKAFADEVKKASQNTYMNSREIESTCDNVIKSSRKLLEDIKELNKSKQGNKLYIELKLAQKEMKTNVNLLESKFKGIDVLTFKFEPNKALENLCMQESLIGTLVVQRENSVHPTSICAKAPDDSHKCWITGMTLLSPNVLILTDFLNKSVKMMNVNNNAVISQLSMINPPYDVTRVSSDEIAVLVPEDGHIILMKTFVDKLMIKQRFKLEGNFCRISFFPGRGFVVSFDNPAKLAILDIKGYQRLKVASDKKGKELFAGPDYVTSNKDYIFVSDRVRQAVIRLSWKGEVTGTYSRGLHCPQGLALSDDGTLFVCENRSNKILAISTDFKKSSDFVSDVNRPCAVCFCEKRKQLFVSAATQNKAYDNYVQILSTDVEKS